MEDNLPKHDYMNIEALVKDNPLTKLNSDYGSELVKRIKDTFTEEEISIYLTNLYAYLNYDPRKDFVVDMDHTWKWLGFDKKSNCKSLLVNNFKENVDYIIALEKRNVKIEEVNDDKNEKAAANSPAGPETIKDHENFAAENSASKTDTIQDHIFAAANSAAKTETIQNHENFKKIEKKSTNSFTEFAAKPQNLDKEETRGGSNKEKILLTVRCFKMLCLKAKTKKSHKIHEYYVNLEEIVNDMVLEQAENLKIKLSLKDKEFSDNLISIFRKKQVLYLIEVEKGIIKFGITNDIERRIKEHYAQFGKQIIVRNIFETIYNREFENIIEKDSIISQHIISKMYVSNQTELIQIDDNFSYNDLLKRIEYVKSNIKEEQIPNLIRQIAELEYKLEIKDKEEIITNQEEIISEKNQEIGKLKSKTRVLEKQIKENPFKSINILTGEIKKYKSFSEACKNSGIGPHSLVDNYLDKQVQHKGLVYFSEDKPYWKPPVNFKFDLSVKPSTHMVMCKSIHKETGEIVYYNSIKEAAKIIGLESNETIIRKFSWLCAENVNGRASEHPILNKYKWYKVHQCGCLVYPNGTIQDLPEKLIVKKSNEQGDSEDMIIDLSELDSIYSNNQKIRSAKSIKRTTASFVEEATKIYGNKYDYSLVNYINTRRKVKIICDIHGEFEQTPERHLHSNGCAKCI